MAVLTKSLTRLRSDFNTRFPKRDKASDGWIGDAAHQKSVSGHNPDDTKGSKAEYSDPDNKAEVRAIDVDKDFKESGASMQGIVDAVLATPEDRKRLKYIIFNRRIWSASNGWKPKAYTGSNPHDKHAHFSGHPDYDEDDRPWKSVLNYRKPAQPPAKKEEDDLPSAKEIAEAVWNTDNVVPAPWPVRTDDNPYWAPGTSMHHGLGHAIEANRRVTELTVKVDALIAMLAEAMKSGGGNLESAAVVSKLDDLARRIADLETQLAAARAAVAERDARLAEAFAAS